MVNVAPHDSQYPVPSVGEPAIRSGARSNPAVRKDAMFQSDEVPNLDKIRVLIADDCPAEMALLQHAVRAASYITVVGGAYNGSDAFIKAARTHPDVVLMDYQMALMDGLEATRRIKEHFPGIDILFLGQHSADFVPALSAGADVYLLKDCSQHELLAAIRALVRERLSAQKITVPVYRKTPDRVNETKIGTRF